MQTAPSEGLGVRELTQPVETVESHDQRPPTAPPKDEPIAPAPDFHEDVPHSPETPQYQRMEPEVPPVEPERLAAAPVTEEATHHAPSDGDLRSSDPVQSNNPPLVAHEDVRPSVPAPGPPSPTSKRLKKKQAGPGPPPVQKTSGIRRLFGTKRSKSRDRSAPSSPVETNPAILAARRALEGKDQPAQDLSSSPQSKQNGSNRLRNAKGPVAAVQTVTQPRQQPVRPARSVTPPVEHAALPEPTMAPPPVPEEEQHGPPISHRDEEYDQLSRVDTNEREHADREFSTFDQGPLIEQRLLSHPPLNRQADPVSLPYGRAKPQASTSVSILSSDDGHCDD